MATLSRKASRVPAVVWAIMALLPRIGTAEDHGSGGAQAPAQDIVFAEVDDARRLLSSGDAFTERMSAFDRAARTKTDREVTSAEFLEFAGAAAMPWGANEIRDLSAAYDGIAPRLSSLGLPLPSEVVLVKTTGREEGNAAYTRKNAVIVPVHLLESSPADLQKLLAHELFHIASRSNPEFAVRAYATIGFHPCGEAVFPPSLAQRRITNPDAPRNDYCIALTVDGGSVLATPILFSRSETYDADRGGEFFEYLELALLLRDGQEDRSAAAAPRIVPFADATGFYDQVGRNTEYIVHPEEILADNFALLVAESPHVESPEVLERLRRVLADFEASPSSEDAR